MLDVFQSPPHAEPARRETQIEVWFLEIQSGELCLQVGNVKPAAEKRNEEVCLLQFCMQSVLR